jgi:hypothetical protein
MTPAPMTQRLPTSRYTPILAGQLAY